MQLHYPFLHERKRRMMEMEEGMEGIDIEDTKGRYGMQIAEQLIEIKERKDEKRVNGEESDNKIGRVKKFCN